MAAVSDPTLKASGGSTADGTSFATSAFAYTAGRVYVLDLEYSIGTGNAPSPTGVTTTTASVTWTQVTGVGGHLEYKTSGGNRCSAGRWIGVCTGSGTGTTTVTFGVTMSGMRYVLTERTGVNLTTPYRGGVSVKSLIVSPAVGATMTITMDAFLSSGSRAHGMCGYNSTDSDTIAGTWSTLHHSAHTAPAEAIIAGYGNDVTFSVVNGTGASPAHGLLAIELLPADLDLTDTPGAARAFGPSEALTLGLTVTDAAGHAVAAGPSESLTLGLTLVDVAGAAHATGPAESLTLGLTLTDAPTATWAGEPAETLTLGLTVEDAPGAASAAAPSHELTLGLTLTDTPGAAFAEAVDASLTLGLTIIDDPYAAYAAGTVTTFDLGEVADLELTDWPTAAWSFGTTERFYIDLDFPPDRGGYVPAVVHGGLVPATVRGGTVPAAIHGGHVPPTIRGGYVPRDTRGHE